MSDCSPLSVHDVAAMIMGYQVTQVVYTACSLEVFEELHVSRQVSAERLSATLHTHPGHTERLLNACTGLKLLEKVSDKGETLYKNSSSTEMYLVKSSPLSMRAMLTKVSDLYDIWGTMKDTVRDGGGHLAKTGVFDDNDGVYGSDSKQMEFLQVMHLFSLMDTPAVLTAFDLTQFSHACDLGGGTGALSERLATHYPDMTVTIFDLHRVTTTTQLFIKHNLDNLIIQPGNFFHDELPCADLFILSHVLHDWGEDKVLAILKKVFQALPQGGAVLVLEKFLSAKKDGPIDCLLLDVGMMMMSEGKERTSEEYKTLLLQAGFTDLQIKPLKEAKWRDAILARKY